MVLLRKGWEYIDEGRIPVFLRREKKAEFLGRGRDRERRKKRDHERERETRIISILLLHTSYTITIFI